MDGKHQTQASPELEDGAGGTIVIGLPHLALAVLMVGALAGGFYAARMMAPEPEPPQAVAQPTPIQITMDELSGILGGGGVLPGYGPDDVVPLNPSHPLLGRPYIEIRGKDLSGADMSVSELIGRPIMVNFWATWCPPCLKEMPWMEEAYQIHKDQGFEIVAVDAGERVPPEAVVAVVTNFMTASGLTFPVMLPDDAYQAQLDYTVYGLPSTYMISPEGVIIDAHRGMYPNRVTLLERVENLMRESGL